MGLAEANHPWTARPGVTLQGVPPGGRCREVIDVSFWKLRVDNFSQGVPDKELVVDAWCHISQSVADTRVLISKPLAPCLLSNSVLYSYMHDTTVSGLAYMQTIGWPQSYCSDELILSEFQLRDLSGSAFSLPLASIVSAAMIMNRHASWWQ